jgi:aspartyl-tRNA(Asn)/glutamyl-tRNA(Gln) amidotransferase subunit C
LGKKQIRYGAALSATCALPMSVDSDTVRAIASLARLRVDDDELPALTARFNGILDLFAQLRDVDTDGVEPMANPLDATQPLRADAVTETDRREALQAVAPAVENGLYLVPRVVE